MASDKLPDETEAKLQEVCDKGNPGDSFSPIRMANHIRPVVLEAYSAGQREDMACVDRMVELGELVEWQRESWGQYRVFTTPQVHNR